VAHSMAGGGRLARVGCLGARVHDFWCGLAMEIV
jgi:hypothetical protein